MQGEDDGTANGPHHQVTQGHVQQTKLPSSLKHTTGFVIVTIQYYKTFFLNLRMHFSERFL
jgi:hypothetical protein